MLCLQLMQIVLVFIIVATYLFKFENQIFIFRAIVAAQMVLSIL